MRIVLIFAALAILAGCTAALEPADNKTSWSAKQLFDRMERQSGGDAL